MAVFAVTPVDTTFTVEVGENTLAAANSATAAAASADDAAQSAAYAGGFETPEYASQSAGNAATTPGQIFRVPLGTTPQTFNWYRRLVSGSELVDPLATSEALAGSGGASLIGTEGGGTVQGHIDALAASGGAALVGLDGGGTVQDVATKQQVIVGSTHINVQTEYNAQPGSGQSPTARTAALQNAFNSAPIGSILHFPPGDYIVNDELNFTRQMDIQGHGSRLISVPGSTSKSAIKVRIVEAIGQAVGFANDCRGMHWRDLILLTQGDCLHGLDVQHASGQSAAVIANLKMNIDGGAYAVPDAAAGRAIRFGGLMTQLHTVQGVDIVNGVDLDGCADACRFERNTIYGVKRAFKVNLAEGAFCTMIRDNVITARDGALEVFGGSQIHFTGNQIEQGSGEKNQGLFNCSVLVYASAYRSRGIFITGNNFGGDPYDDVLQHNIVLAGEPSVGAGDFDIRDVVIDENTFFPAAYNWNGAPSTPFDILIANSLVRYTRIGNRNRVRGIGSARGGSSFTTYPAIATNTLNDRDLLSVSDGGIGTYGAWRASGTLALQNGYGGGLRYRKAEDDTLIFEGQIVSATAGANNAGTVIGTLPVGFRPAAGTYVMATAVAAGVGGQPCPLFINSNGEVSLAAGITTADIRFDGVTCAIAGRASYSPGA